MTLYFLKDEQLIVNLNRRLQKLKEQQALQGQNTPPEILIDIEDTEAKIKKISLRQK